MIEDIAWFEEGVNDCSAIIKVLKVKIDGKWHKVPTVPLDGLKSTDYVSLLTPANLT
jgi:hypothetical protein